MKSSTWKHLRHLRIIQKINTLHLLKLTLIPYFKLSFDSFFKFIFFKILQSKYKI